MIGKYKYSNATKTQWDIVSQQKGSNYPDVEGDASDVVAGIKLVTDKKFSASWGSTHGYRIYFSRYKNRLSIISFRKLLHRYVQLLQ